MTIAADRQKPPNRRSWPKVRENRVRGHEKYLAISRHSLGCESPDCHHVNRRTERKAMTEIWKPIKELDGLYEVSNLGRVRSANRIITDSLGRKARYKSRVLSLYLSPSGYPELRVRKEGRPCRFRVHRLVLKAFRGSPLPDQVGCHNDGNPLNNRLENLRWGTLKDNAQDCLKHGTNYWANRTHCPRDHPLEGRNLAPYAKSRTCLACARARAYCKKYKLMHLFEIYADRYFEQLQLTQAA